MIDIIIFAIIAFFLIKKLTSVLGNEYDQKAFGYESTTLEEQATMKDAEPVNTKKKDLFEGFDYLSEATKTYAKEIASKIDGFTLEKFQDIATKVLEKTIKANNEKDVNTLKKLLSPELLDTFKQSFEDEKINQIILVAINETKIENIVKTGDIFEIEISFKMKQINYTTNANSEIVDGSKNNFVDVNEKWFFEHNFASKSTTWFVEKIESFDVE